jgi:fluoride exporter
MTEHTTAHFFAIFLGGGCGSVLRYLVSLWFLNYGKNTFAKDLANGGFPYATLCINVVGSFLIGVVVQLASSTTGTFSPISPTMRLALAVGFCGGFTTFSTFSLETLTLLQAGRTSLACTYAVLSVVACVAAATAGVAVTMWFEKIYRHA